MLKIFHKIIIKHTFNIIIFKNKNNYIISILCAYKFLWIFIWYILNEYI